MTNKNILIVIAVGVVFLVGGYYLGNRNSTITEETSNTEIATGEINIGTDAVATSSTNSNGSVVTKPVIKVPVTTSQVGTYLKLGQKTTVNGVKITPIKISYDSRCPKDVKCIQAGSLDLGVLLESGTLSQNMIVTLGKPIAFAEKEITLTGVSPSKVSTKPTLDYEYRFTFTVK